MAGYDPKFLGVDIPLPSFSPSVIGDVLENDGLAADADGVMAVADYPHYSVAMNRRERLALSAALNIDQKKFVISTSRDWRIDTRIGADFQFNNDLSTRVMVFMEILSHVFLHPLHWYRRRPLALPRDMAPGVPQMRALAIFTHVRFNGSQRR